MTCTNSSIATPWEYAAFWCKASIRTGSDNGGVDGSLTLVDTSADFEALGVEANVGMVLENLTQKTSGIITGMTTDSIVAAGVSWDDGDNYRVVTLTGNEISTIQVYLDITSADIYAALSSQGQCDCSWTVWGTQLVKKLNIIEAAIFHNCPCGSPQLSEDQLNAYMEFVNTQMQKIIDGDIDICGGTGSNFPSIDFAQNSEPTFNAGKIIINDILRGI